MVVSIPVRPDDLTAAWLGEVLAEHHPGVAVASVASERIGEGVGFIGQIHRLTATYADDPTGELPSSFIAKMPTNDDGGRTMGMMMRLYEKEAGFYRHLAAQCPVEVPRCWFNGEAPQSQAWCLVLEDFPDLAAGNQLQALQRDEAAVLLGSLARIHATWSDGRADDHVWLPRIDDPCNTGLLDLFEASLPVTMERYGHVIPSHAHHWAPAFYPHARAWLATFASQAGATVCHGDFRTDNLLFRDDGTHVVLDWQVASRGPGSYDLYYFLAMCLDGAATEAHAFELIDLYLDERRAAGGGPLDRDVVLDQLRHLGLYFFVMGIPTFAMLDPTNDRAQELFIGMWRRGFALAEVLDIAAALPA
jgi:hypothetical protein